MKSLSAIAVLLLLCGWQCSKERHGEWPACIGQKIMALKRQPKANPRATVWEYRDTTNNKSYYLFSAACCDQYAKLYDASCQYICAPSGGITGQGDGKCSTLKQALVPVRLVWKDER